MRLDSIELAFLERLSLIAWTSPPVFDHRLLDRVVEAGYVTTLSSARDAVHYEITDTGRAAVIAVTSLAVCTENPIRVYQMIESAKLAR
jgi:DNA-binding PadR family transcriptional regulator